MSHKAFVFDDGAFERELRDVLLQALRTGDHGPIKSFIEANRPALKDPYEGEALADDWESLLSPKDVHQYGVSKIRQASPPRVPKPREATFRFGRCESRVMHTAC